MANLQISKVDNYIHIYDMDKNVFYSEHSFRVFVKKHTLNGGVYDISFLRPESTPSAFYTVRIGQIYDNNGNLFNQAGWELWYQKNTGDINGFDNNVTITAPLGHQTCDDSVSTTLCQANARVIPFIGQVDGLKDMAYFIGPFAQLHTLTIINQSTTAFIRVSADGGGSFVKVVSGEPINFDAGALLNFFDPASFWIDSGGVLPPPLCIATYT